MLVRYAPSPEGAPAWFSTTSMHPARRKAGGRGQYSGMRATSRRRRCQTVGFSFGSPRATGTCTAPISCPLTPSRTGPPGKTSGWYSPLPNPSVLRPKSASQVRHASLDPLLLPAVKATAVFVFETDVFVPDLLGYLAYVTTVPRTRTRVAIAGGRLARERHGQAVGNGCYRRYPWCSRYARTYAADFGRRTLADNGNAAQDAPASH